MIQNEILLISCYLFEAYEYIEPPEPIACLCFNGTSISSDKLCDGFQNCDSGEDELPSFCFEFSPGTNQ